MPHRSIPCISITLLLCPLHPGHSLFPPAPRLSLPCIPALPLASFPQLQHLQQRLSEAEGEFHQREKDLSRSLEEARGHEKKLLADARNLQLKMEAARSEAAELSLRLSAAEGRAQGLEAELARGEEQRRAAETRLGSLQSALRRTMGIGRARAASLGKGESIPGLPCTLNLALRPHLAACPPPLHPVPPRPSPSRRCHGGDGDPWLVAGP